MATSEENYTPNPAPRNIPAELQYYLDEELERIAGILNTSTLSLEVLASAPAKPENGMLAYADGTNWNPGSGEGFYGYQAGAWVKL